MVQVEYNKILLVAWRFVRVFVAVFLTEVGMGFARVENFNAGKSLVMAGIGAGLVSMGKAIREWFKENEADLYDSLVRKLPF